MRIVKRTAGPALLLLGAVAAGAEGPAKTQVADADVVSWVTRHVRAWQPTAAERVFDEIAWVGGLVEAQRLAKQHGRPVFLFTHDGHMAVGRC
jgi:hypothetical protein